MKLEVESNVVQSSGMQNNSQFKIRTSAHAFKILSSGLYSDKIAAVLREIGCNAMDSHIAAGKPDVPFEVHMPTRLVNKFYIRDYGTGMSHDDIIDLYTTYFSSSKSQSNDFTGAFGLGSKSPFAYTDRFALISYYNGTKTTYAAYVGDDGAPNVSKVSEMPMADGEENGLMVSMAIKPEDHWELARKARQIFRHFRVKPRMINMDQIQPLEYTAETPTWATTKDEVYGSALYCVMGNVAYSVPNHNLGSDIRHYIEETHPEFRFNIGELDVAASREQLEFTPRTINAIKQRVEQFIREHSASLRDKLKSLKYSTWSEQIQTMEDLAQDDYLRRNMGLVFRTAPTGMFDQDKMDMLSQLSRGHTYWTVPNKYVSGKYRLYTTRNNRVSVDDVDWSQSLNPKVWMDKKTYVLIPDGSKYLRDRLRTQSHIRFYWISNDPVAAAEFAKDMGEMPTMKVGDIPLPVDWVQPSKRPRKPRVKKPKELIAEVMTFNNGNAAQNTVDVLLTKDASQKYYITRYTAWGVQKYACGGNVIGLGDLVRGYAKIQPSIPNSPTAIALLTEGEVRKYKLEEDGWKSFATFLTGDYISSSTAALVDSNVNTTVVTHPDRGYSAPLTFLSTHAHANTPLWQAIKSLLPNSELVQKAAAAGTSGTLGTVNASRPIPVKQYNLVLTATRMYNHCIDEATFEDKSAASYPTLAAALSYTFPRTVANKNVELAARMIASLISLDKTGIAPEFDGLKLAA